MCDHLPMPRITVHPDICNGQPVVEGTRVTVSTVLEFLAAGDSVADVLDEYPALTEPDVRACMAYGSRLAGNHFQLEPVG
jgi:uncharacterized protein (DUF433 family)